jgi:hypothetical protein
MQLMEAVLAGDEFQGGKYDTHLLMRLKMEPSYVEVLQPPTAAVLSFRLLANASASAIALTQPLG